MGKLANMASTIGKPNPSAQTLTKKEMKKAQVHPGPTPWTPEPWEKRHNVKPHSERPNYGPTVVKHFEGQTDTTKMLIGKPAKQGQREFNVAGVTIHAMNLANAQRKVRA